MKTLIHFFIACSIPLISRTQVATETPDQPSIEVNGMAEMHVVPDEVYIQFYLKEYEKDKTLQTIEMQEQTLTAALQSAGLQMQEINVSDFESNYVRVEWGKRDYRQEKKYDFKVRTLQETAKVFEVFEKLEITRASITRVDHSLRKTYENDMRIAATKNAKTRADDMLQAIGQKAGKALFVKEVYTSPVVGLDANYYNDKLATDLSTFKGGAIVQYQKIKISASVFARFAIN